MRGIRGARSLKIARNYGTRVISFFFFFRESFRRRKNSGVYSLILLKGLEDGFVQEYEQSVNNRIEWNGYYPNVTKLVESSIHFRSSVSQTALLLLFPRIIYRSNPRSITATTCLSPPRPNREKRG